MIIDAFLYAGEADMLELRLRTLNGVVDHFIAVEIDVTHQGDPRRKYSIRSGAPQLRT